MKREPVGNEREQDRWLNAALRQPPGPASADCLDSETLAAFADGGLSAQATAAVELHASSCARCTAVLAAMERSAPVGVSAHAWTPAGVMRWLIPLTAAATAVAIWVAVPERPITSVVEDLKTTSEQVPDPVPVPPPVPAPLRDARSAPVPVPNPGSAAIAQPETLNQNPAPTTQNRETEQPADVRSRPFAPEAFRDATGAPAAREAAPASPQQPPAAAPAEASQGLARTEPTAAPSLSADTFAETVAPTAQRMRLEAKVIVSSESAAPNEQFRWRVINGTSIERSVDGGKTWTGTVPLPRDSVKGLTIAGIRATSDLHATVRMSNGSEFYTANGGKSWIHLQEK